jgi:hypothetical protein
MVAVHFDVDVVRLDVCGFDVLAHHRIPLPLEPYTQGCLCFVAWVVHGVCTSSCWRFVRPHGSGGVWIGGGSGGVLGESLSFDVY